jgi:hypothetical protein
MSLVFHTLSFKPAILKRMMECLLVWDRLRWESCGCCDARGQRRGRRCVNKGRGKTVCKFCGDLGNGEITLRWASATRAGYNVAFIYRCWDIEMARRLVGGRVETVEVKATALLEVVSSRVTPRGVTPRGVTPRFSDWRRRWRRLNQTRLSLLSWWRWRRGGEIRHWHWNWERPGTLVVVRLLDWLSPGDLFNLVRGPSNTARSVDLASLGIPHETDPGAFAANKVHGDSAPIKLSTLLALFTVNVSSFSVGAKGVKIWNRISDAHRLKP